MKRPLSRQLQKYYTVPYVVKDNGGLMRNSSFQLIVGDLNNNMQYNGSKIVNVLRYENNIQPNIFMGTLYVRDLDDWDLAGKQASSCFQTTGNAFVVRQGKYFCF